MDTYLGLDGGEMRMGLDLAGIGISRVDYVADTVILDEIAADVFGLTAGEAISRPQFHDRIHPADRAIIEAQVDQLLDPAFADMVELNHRTIDATGATRWVSARKQLYRGGNPDGPAQTGIAAIRDVTREMMAREKNELLLQELAHRTRNLVSLAGVIARQTMDRSGPDSFLDGFLPRLNNLAEAEELVSSRFQSNFRELAELTLSRFEGIRDGRIHISGEALPLTQTGSQTFAMILHELMTNAIKYGALSQHDGRVEVSWHDDGEEIRFVWTESGGPVVAPPEKTGFGNRVLVRFAQVSFGVSPVLNYRPEGLLYSLSAPRESVVTR